MLMAASRQMIYLETDKTNVQGIGNPGKSRLRPSSCSGMTTADIAYVNKRKSYHIQWLKKQRNNILLYYTVTLSIEVSHLL